MNSKASLIASLSDAERKAWVSSLTKEQAAALRWEWAFFARPEQLAPEGNWDTWLILSGRGWGKSRTGAEWVRSLAESGKAKRIALVGATAADVRDVMIEGESGIMSICPPWDRPLYEPSKRRITWPNGAMATAYSADEPDRLRGPQHDAAWCDEIAAWRYGEAWDQLRFGLRLGDRPQTVVTTTPRPTQMIRDLIKHKTTVVTKGSTYDNRMNLAPTFFSQIISKYEGTRIGRQELHAELLDDVQGALWQHADIDKCRVSTVPLLRRAVVAIDPAVTSGEHSDETGIIVAGIDEKRQGYVIADLSGQYSPGEWAKVAVDAYYKYDADRVVAEVNNGGDLVEFTLRTVAQNVSYKDVRATRGKFTRAEPIAALYEQHKIHHVGMFAKLEDQMCTYVPGGKSPDRMDALVWAFFDLIVKEESFSIGTFGSSVFSTGLRNGRHV